MTTPVEDFDSAVAALYSQLHQSTTPAAINAAAARRTNTIHDMHTYLHRLGLTLNDNGNENTNCNSSNRATRNYIPPLIIHITGTKGKGSTLSYCESLLRNAYGFTTGMFTSPHLVCIRERIRINGIPVSKQVFAEAYWAVRRKLEENSHVLLQTTAEDALGDGNPNADQVVVGEEESLPPLPTLPGYFRMLTLMALYTFSHHDGPKVDAILLEVGMGGRYDATNVFEPNNYYGRVLVRGITLIDYDHTRVLGSTLEQIAWEKGGIFVSDKRGKIGRSDGGYDKFLEGYDQQLQEEEEEGVAANQLFVNGCNIPQVCNVLRAIVREEEGSSFQLVNDSVLESISGVDFHADHQRGNAALALAMCRHAIGQYEKLHDDTKMSSGDVTNEKISAALKNTFWPGRLGTHTLTLPSKNSSEVSLKLRCDGAHTPLSIKACINWFQSILSTYRDTAGGENNGAVRRVLIFNCGHERNPIPLLHSLHRSEILFDCVYFSRADCERPSAIPKKLLDEWLKEELVDPLREEECTINFESMCNKVKELGILSSLECDGHNSSSWQQTLAKIWRVLELYYSHASGNLSPSSTEVGMEKIVVGLKVADAIKQIILTEEARVKTGKQTPVEILVTGSLYLVGSALEAVGWEEGESEGILNTSDRT